MVSGSAAERKLLPMQAKERGKTFQLNSFRVILVAAGPIYEAVYYSLHVAAIAKHPLKLHDCRRIVQFKHPMPEQYSGDSWTIEGWFRSGVSSISAGDEGASTTSKVLLLSVEEPKETLPKEPPPKEPKLN
ncbi:hypothetical protein Tco_1076713 [Tanacetum coccineum]